MMKVPSIQLVAIDLDGTLLNDDKRITAETLRTIQTVMARGVSVVLASGRPWCSVLPYARQLGLNTPIIAHSGAYMADETGRVYADETLEAAEGPAVIRMLEDAGYYFKVYCRDVFYVQVPTQETLDFSRIYKVPYQAVGTGRLALLDKPVNRIMIYDRPERIEAVEKLLLPWSDVFSYARDSARGLDILPRGVNKGSALRLLCSRLQVDLKKVMAIGNEGNDIEMICEAGLGVAMGNSCLELKACAAAVTAGNQAEGVAQALKTYVLQE